KSKLAGEQLIIDRCKKYVIIRTSWLYSKYGNNFVKKIIDLSKINESINVVLDEIGTPTNATDLAKDMLFIAEQKLGSGSKIISKLYHYANGGSVSRFEFAKKIVEYAEIDCKVNPVNSDYFNFAAKRPKNSSLDQSKIIHDQELSIRSWDVALKECIKNILSDEK
ncbi:MAG: sugar nucleotide-binding protein, partial [Candidatus Delongbacteria bacterium]|nr:sugar nucleotide-binding protein [Candidatus Delongbacteria bacterium]